MNNVISYHQRGAVLAICLIVVAIIALLSITAIKTAFMEQLFANNLQFEADAFAAAERALVEGEKEIETNYSGLPMFDWSADPDDGFYNVGELADVTDLKDGTEEHETGPNGGLYTLEYLGPYTVAGTSVTMGAGTNPNRRFIYRVTGMGTGAQSSFRMVQSIYATTD